jgi:RNA polymerase sigma factor (sigma-70 family)
MDEQALHKAFAGDRAALRDLLDEVRPVIHTRVARNLLRLRRKCDRQDVEDLVQEVFLALFENDARLLRAWSADRGLSLKNFVGLVAERLTSSILRSGRRSGHREDATEAARLQLVVDAVAQARQPGLHEPEEALMAKQSVDVLLERLRRDLSPKAYRFFELMWVEERSQSEISRELGLSPNAIYTQRSRLVSAIRRILSELNLSPASLIACES